MTVRSLAEALRDWDDARLEELLAARPDLLAPVPADLGQLAARAATAPSVARALDDLNRWTLTVLEAVCVALDAAETGPDHFPAAATWAQVQVLLGGPEKAGREQLDLLLGRALVWGDDDSLEVPGGVREVVGYRTAGLGPSLRLLLGTLSYQRLGALAEDLALDEPVDAEAALDSIIGALSDPNVVEGLLSAAPEGARELLDQLVWGPPIGSLARANRVVRLATAASVGDWLLAHGLLVAADASTVVLPREVALLLRGGRLYPAGTRTSEPAAVVVETRDATSVDHASAERAATVVRQVETLLEAWGLDGPPVLRSGGLGVRELRRAALLMEIDEGEAALVAEVAYAAGLIGTGNDAGPRWLPTPGYDLWRTTATADRWGLLAQAWLSSDRVAALVGERDDRDRIQPALAPGIERTIAAELRTQVLALLARSRAGQVLDPAGIEEVLAFRQPRRPARLRHNLVEWTLRESELLGITGGGALGSAGRALLEAGAEAAAQALAPLLPVPVRHVLLQGDLTAIAPGPLVSELAAELSLLADVESTGGATVYRFTEASIRRALDAGKTAADLHELLASISTTPVPQALDYLIDDMARRHGQIRVGALSSYVRSDAPGVLTELLADRRAQLVGLRRLAPTVLGSSSAPDRLLEVLRSMGLAPAAEAADGALILRRPDAHRAVPGPRTTFAGSPAGGLLRDRPVPAPSATLLRAAVRALRAGDRAAGPRGPVIAGMATGTNAVSVPRGAALATLDRLREALENERPVWIGYVDAHGATSERIIEPVQLDGGYLTAYDHRRDAMRTFAVHRITGVADIDDIGDTEPDDRTGPSAADEPNQPDEEAQA